MCWKGTEPEPLSVVPLVAFLLGFQSKETKKAMILAFVFPPLGSEVCFVRLLPLPRIFVLSPSPSLSRTTYIYSSSSPDSREEGSWRRLELWDLSLNFTFASLRWKKKSACHCTCILQVVVRIFYRSGIHLLRVLKKYIWGAKDYREISHKWV